MRQRLSFLLGLALALSVPGGAEATPIGRSVTVDLGTAGRAAQFADTRCGKARPAIQSGVGITPDDSGCGDDGATLSETFTIPPGAFDIALTITGFSASSGVQLIAGSATIEAGAGCDDGDCTRENGGHSSADARGTVIDDLHAGATYGIDIRFRGFGTGDDRDDRTRAAIATLAASLSYAMPVTQLPPPQQGAAAVAPAPAVPEPASALIFPAAVALLAWRRRRGQTASVNTGLSGRRAPPSTTMVSPVT